jgi:hypothetical protein
VIGIRPLPDMGSAFNKEVLRDDFLTALTTKNQVQLQVCGAGVLTENQPVPLNEKDAC